MTEAHVTVVKVVTAYDTYVDCTCGWRSLRGPSWDSEALARWHYLAAGATIPNPLLDAFLATETAEELTACAGIRHIVPYARRRVLTSRYAWAIPTELVIRRLAELSPICDLGCGTGYWASLLQAAGATVLAVDAAPPASDKDHWHKPDEHLQHFTDVVPGDAATFDVPTDHALMLCWPPYANPMAAVALARYRGQRVIYVGEHGGCTADEAFHDALTTLWHEVARYEIPQWSGIHDYVTVHERRA